MNRFGKLITAILLIISLPIIIWASGFIIYLGTITSMTEPATITKTDAIIVLTGGSNRVTRGLDLLAQGQAHALLISGVHKDVKLKELFALWGYDKNPPACCITLGHNANTTLGNALEARSWVLENNVRSVRLITATYHMPRAMVEFRQVLPSLTIIQHPVQPDHFSVKTKNFWMLAMREYHKLAASMGRIFLFLMFGGKNPV